MDEDDDDDDDDDEEDDEDDDDDDDDDLFYGHHCGMLSGHGKLVYLLQRSCARCKNLKVPPATRAHGQRTQQSACLGQLKLVAKSPNQHTKIMRAHPISIQLLLLYFWVARRQQDYCGLQPWCKVQRLQLTLDGQTSRPKASRWLSSSAGLASLTLQLRVDNKKGTNLNPDVDF